MRALNLFFCLGSTNIGGLARRHVKAGAMHLAAGMEGMFAAEGETVKWKEAKPPFRLSALNPLSATYYRLSAKERNSGSTHFPCLIELWTIFQCLDFLICEMGVLLAPT